MLSGTAPTLQTSGQSFWHIFALGTFRKMSVLYWVMYWLIPAFFFIIIHSVYCGINQLITFPVCYADQIYSILQKKKKRKKNQQQQQKVKFISTPFLANTEFHQKWCFLAWFNFEDCLCCFEFIWAVARLYKVPKKESAVESCKKKKKDYAKWKPSSWVSLLSFQCTVPLRKWLKLLLKSQEHTSKLSFPNGKLHLKEIFWLRLSNQKV